MRQRRTAQLRSWLRDRRISLIFSFLGVLSSVVGVYVIYTAARHPVNGDHSRTIFVAFALVLLGATFLIGTVATAPIQVPLTSTSVQGSNIYLPRAVAWGILAPIAAECTLVWFTHHDDLDLAVFFAIIAIALNFVGQMGAVALRAQLSSSSPHPS